MLILNCSRAHNKVNNSRELFKLKISIKVPKMPNSGLGQTLKPTGYSIECM